MSLKILQKEKKKIDNLVGKYLNYIKWDLEQKQNQKQKQKQR